MTAVVFRRMERENEEKSRRQNSLGVFAFWFFFIFKLFFFFNKRKQQNGAASAGEVEARDSVCSCCCFQDGRESEVCALLECTPGEVEGDWGSTLWTP